MVFGRAAKSGGGSDSAADPQREERRRARRRRQFLRKSAEKRQRIVQYRRRHNEWDGKLFYCPFCDVFVSSRAPVWRRHRGSAGHLSAVEAYYRLAADYEEEQLAAIQARVAEAWLAEGEDLARTRGMTSCLAAVRVAPHIVVGGPAPTPAVVPPPPPPPPVAITVGGKPIPTTAQERLHAQAQASGSGGTQPPPAPKP